MKFSVYYGASFKRDGNGLLKHGQFEVDDLNVILSGRRYRTAGCIFAVLTFILLSAMFGLLLQSLVEGFIGLFIGLTPTGSFGGAISSIGGYILAYLVVDQVKWFTVPLSIRYELKTITGVEQKGRSISFIGQNQDGSRKTLFNACSNQDALTIEKLLTDKKESPAMEGTDFRAS